MLKRIVIYFFAIVLIVSVTAVIGYVATIYYAGSAQQGFLALTQATVLVGEELETHNNTTVLIRDGSIIEIGDDNTIEIPQEAIVLDLNGYTLIPGLIDLHVHLASPEMERGGQMGVMQLPRHIFNVMRFVPGKRRAFLNHGVTTVRDLGSEHEWIMDFRRQIRNGELEGPRLFAAGPIFTTPGGHPVVTIGVDAESDAVRLPSTPEEARFMVRGLATGNQRVDVIKVVQERGRDDFPMDPVPEDILQAIVAEAKDNNLPVTVHWGTLDDLKDALAAGIDELQHLEPRGVLAEWPAGILDELVEREVAIAPTLAVTDAALPSEIAQQLRNRVGEFHEAGGRVVAGSDAGMPGVPSGAGLHRELELLTESGLAPKEALKAATSEAARILGAENIGSIEEDHAADLVVVKGNPVQDIWNLRNVAMVFRNGRLVLDQRDEE